MHAESINNTVYRPVFIPKAQYADSRTFNLFIGEYGNAIVLDLFASQFKELIKVQTPKTRFTPQQLDQQYTDWLGDRDASLLGCWIYYPWSNRLLHTLDEADFIELRTARNRHKITLGEQNALARRKIGIIGLSVGHSVALTLATERLFGSLRLADFDTLELSNLNRIRTGIHNSGLNKSIITAREIAEIDPFLDITCYTDGITSDNLNDFLCQDGKLDLLIDECDDIEIKIKCREFAKPLGIPVVMETSDRGMLDVERFDLESERPILHGFLNDIPKERLQNIAPADRLGLVMRIVDVAKSSLRGKASLLEVGQTISTWPQLASAVTLGGGVVADVTRRILLGQFTESGRYYVDLEQIIGNKAAAQNAVYTHTDEAFNLAAAIEEADSLSADKTINAPDDDTIRQIVEAGTQAASQGNDQPWKWLYRNGRLFLFHDPARSASFLNFNNLAAHFALGAAFRNIILKSKELGYSVSFETFPPSRSGTLIAAAAFFLNDSIIPYSGAFTNLAAFIPERVTDRGPGIPYELGSSDLDDLAGAAEDIHGARIDFIRDSGHISEIGKVVAACDLLAMLNEQGHHDLFNRDIRWTQEQHEDGIALTTLAADPAQLTALSMLKDKRIAAILNEVNGGDMLKERISSTIGTSACIAVITVPDSGRAAFEAGSIAEELWLRAVRLGLAAQPLLSPALLFERLKTGEGLSEREQEKLNRLLPLFQDLIKVPAGSSPAFLLRIHKSSTIATRTNRLPLDKILFIVNSEI